MANYKIAYGATQNLTVTNLNSLSGGNMWLSAQVTESSPVSDRVKISYKLTCNASVAADEQIIFRLIKGDDDSTEIRDANVSTSEQSISTANTISDIQDGVNIARVVRIDRVSQVLYGVFTIYDPGPDWQVCIELDSASGAFAASGNTVSYSLGYPQSS